MNHRNDHIMKLRDQKPALLLVDVQKAFLNEEYWGGNRNNKDAEAKCGTILKKWRELHLPVIHIRHSSLNADSIFYHSKEGYKFVEPVEPEPGELIISKKVNSAFIGTDLQEYLDQLRISDIVIVGLTTDHCVSTTTRMSGNLGYNTFVIADATATFDRSGVNGEKFDSELIHATTLASLNGEFATVWDSHELSREL